VADASGGDGQAVRAEGEDGEGRNPWRWGGLLLGYRLVPVARGHFGSLSAVNRDLATDLTGPHYGFAITAEYGDGARFISANGSFPLCAGTRHATKFMGKMPKVLD
jgi:hypothetical protein